MNPAATVVVVVIIIVVVVVSDAVFSLLLIANRLLLFLYLNYLSCYVNCDVEFVVRSTMMSRTVRYGTHEVPRQYVCKLQYTKNYCISMSLYHTLL